MMLRKFEGYWDLRAKREQMQRAGELPLRLSLLTEFEASQAVQRTLWSLLFRRIEHNTFAFERVSHSQKHVQAVEQ